MDLERTGEAFEVGDIGGRENAIFSKCQLENFMVKSAEVSAISDGNRVDSINRSELVRSVGR